MKVKALSITILSFSLIIFSCNKQPEKKSLNPENWAKRSININDKDSLEYGKSYLSIYSQIYNRTEHITANLTAMVSMRNTSDIDTIYLLKAEYFDTYGKSVRTYFDSPIYLAPLETTEIVIDEVDISGGTGSNFIFEWKTKTTSPEPLFEAIMSSTMGQQGLSFTTVAKRIQ